MAKSAAKELFLPGWAVPQECYLPLLKQAGSDATIHDFGFFQAGEAALAVPQLPGEPGDTSPVRLWGHSMGALWALQLALEHPERVQQVILFNPFPRFLQDEDFSYGWPPAAVQSMVESLPTRPAAVVGAFLRRCAMPGRFNQPLPAELNVTALVAGLEFIAAADLRGRLASLQGRVYVLAGAEDRIAPPAMCAFFQSLPQLQMRTMANAGHMMTWQQPEECVAVLAEMGAL